MNVCLHAHIHTHAKKSDDCEAHFLRFITAKVRKANSVLPTALHTSEETLIYFAGL